MAHLEKIFQSELNDTSVGRSNDASEGCRRVWICTRRIEIGTIQRIEQFGAKLYAV